MEDTHIVGLYWSRSETAISETAAKYEKYLFTIAYGILSSTEDAEESVNDTYLDAWNSMPPHRPAFLSTFLGKITRRISIDRWRGRTAEKRGGGETALALHELEECVASRYTVEHEVGERELVQALDSFLAQCPVSEIFSSMPRFGTSSESGIVLTGRRYGLLIDSDSAPHVYDFMTGERAIIEDFQYPVENAFTTMNSAGNKLLFVRFDPEADGLGVSKMGVLNLETYSFIVFDREGYEVRREDTVSWFDNDRIAISASTEEQGYLYLISVAF